MGRKDTVDRWWSQDLDRVRRTRAHRHRRRAFLPRAAAPVQPVPPAPQRTRPVPQGIAAVPARGAAGRRFLVLLLWLLLVASLALWWRDTPAGSLDNRGEVLLAAGRITGLIAGYLLLVQVFLMSRIGLLERWVGAEHLAWWHRDLGAVLVVAVLLHFGAILYGYSTLDGVRLLPEFTILIDEYEDMLSGVVAAGILVGVGLLAIRAIRSVLPYEVWHVLHQTSYLVLLFGYGHQFANGQQLFRPGPARTFWIGLYAAVLASLAWGRLVAPVFLNLRHRFRVAQVVPEGPDMVSIYLSGRKLDRAGQAGQFFRWRFLTGMLWTQAHPFSLSASPHQHWLRLTVKAVGRHTQALRELPPGARVWAQGPAGGFTAYRRTRQRSLLIAGGSGIAPIRALLEELPAGASVIYRASNAEDVVLKRELDGIAHARGAEVWYVLGSRDDPGPRSVFTRTGLRQLVPDVARRDVYLCGPPGLVEAAVRAVRSAGVPRRQIHRTTFEL